MSTMIQWLMAGVAALVVGLFNKVSGLGQTVLNGVQSGLGLFVSPASLHTMDIYLAYVNFFFPLTETVGFATSLFALWVVSVTYRAVKSWIPTVSG
jgi:hypothetical protein